jgi:F-type H+-transporting ATPase subunit b
MRPVRGIAALASAGIVVLSASAHAEAAKKGMPQLDLANPLTISQVVWLAIIFFALYLLLDHWGLPKVAVVLEARAKTIADDLEAARAAKAQSDAALAEMTLATRKAQAEAQAQVTGAVDAAKLEAASQAMAANAKLDAQLAEAEKRIAAARASAVGALREVSTTTATNVVTRLAGFTPDAAVIDNAVGRALAARAA